MVLVNGSALASDRASGYICIETKHFKAGDATEFPLYIHNPSNNQFVLFKNENSQIRQAQLDQLHESGRLKLFVPKENAKQLAHFLSGNLSQIVDNPSLPVEEKTRQFHTLASTVMQDLFATSPDSPEFFSTAQNVSDSMANLISGEPKAIAELYRLRQYDYYTFSHSMNVCVFGIGLYQKIKSDIPLVRIQDLTRGLLLHDIGKCNIPSEIINKNGKLTEEEWTIMRSHPQIGYDLLAADEALSADSRSVALHHHEALDGSGYPSGLKGDQIPLTSRICKIVDVFDALTSKRSYKPAMPAFEALNLMIKKMMNQLDQAILQKLILFLHHIGQL